MHVPILGVCREPLAGSTNPDEAHSRHLGYEIFSDLGCSHLDMHAD
jgi:hypothetical protein